MKPKLFIGSSVEGLNVAYAIQQNLTHDAEATVWDQGVFELSKTTIESLINVVDVVDFGIFVFSPDDTIVMRGNESTTVRDNVLFELGLFVGKLGRDRVFYVVPDGSSVHIPTDLMGVTPGKYDPNREDKSIQAATGSACNQIRIKINKLGSLRPFKNAEQADISNSGNRESSSAWWDDFNNKEFESAKAKLEEIISTQSSSEPSDEILKNKVWLAYTEFKLNKTGGLKDFYSVAEEHKESLKVQEMVSTMLYWEDYNEKAIEVAERALERNPLNDQMTIILADCYKDDGDLDKAIEVLNNALPSEKPEIAIALAKIHEENGDLDKAIYVVHNAYSSSPNVEGLMYKYARLLQDKNKYKEALYLLNTLTHDHPKNVEYWGYLGNTCVSLDLFDRAIIAYNKAEELSPEEEAWILENVGNVFNNKGLYTNAVSWLHKGLTIDPLSQYAHERLAQAIQNKEEEEKTFAKHCREGRKLIMHFSVEAIEKTTTDQEDEVR